MNACNETYDQNKTKCLIKKKQYFFFLTKNTSHLKTRRTAIQASFKF